MRRGLLLVRSVEDPTRVEIAYLNSVVALLDYGAKLAVTVVITPILVSGLGPAMYGVWKVLQRSVSYLEKGDGRPTEALKWVIADHQFSEDQDEKRQFVANALGVWLFFFPILLCVGLTIAWFLPDVVDVPSGRETTVRLAGAVMVCGVLLSGFVGIPRAVLRGLNRDYRRHVYVAIATVVGGAAMVLALRAGWGLPGVAAGSAVETLLVGLAFWWVVKKTVTWYRLSRPSVAGAKRFFKLSVWYSAWALVNQGITASDVLVLGIAGSAALVSEYTLSAYAAITLVGVLTVVIGAAMPGLGGIVGTGEYEKALKIRGQMMQLSWLLLTVGGGCILLWNRSFVSLWVGENLYAGNLENVLIVILALQLVFLRNDAQIINLTLDLTAKVWTGLLSTAMAVGMGFVLVQRNGIIGLCLAFIAGRLVLSIGYPVIVYAKLNGRPESLMTLFRAAGVTVTIFGAMGYLGSQISAPGWLYFVGIVPVSAAILTPITLWTGLKKEARQALFARLRPSIDRLAGS